MNDERSHFIFSLATKIGIPFTPGEQAPLEDSMFHAFRDEYLRLSADRDIALSQHLLRNPALFRVHLPYNNRVFNVAAQLLWYLDEIIIRDPIGILLERVEDNIEGQKANLRESLQFLSFFKEPIEQGFVLFASNSLLSPTQNAPEEVLDLILGYPEVKSALQKNTYCGYTVRPDSMGNPMGVFQVMLDSGGQFGFTAINLKGGTSVESPAIMVGEILPPISPEQLHKLLGHDPFEQMLSVFKREINRAIQSVQRADRLNAAILFDRELDGLILSRAGFAGDNARQQSVSQVLNFTLPYIQGVPPEQLQNLRSEMPDAFKEFRARLLEIVQQSLIQNDATTADIKNKIDREVVPHIRSLKSELDATVKKNALLGVGLPIISAMGFLGGWFMGARPELLLLPALAGPASAVNALADFWSTKAKLKSNPFYFLWQAQKRVGK